MEIKNNKKENNLLPFENIPIGKTFRKYVFDSDDAVADLSKEIYLCGTVFLSGSHQRVGISLSKGTVVFFKAYDKCCFVRGCFVEEEE